MQLSQPTLEPHSLCYTCWVRVVYSPMPPLHFFLLFFWGYSTAAQLLPTRGSSPGATRSTRTSRQSSPSRCPCGALLPRASRLCITLPHTLYQTFVINVINNIRTRFIISFTWYVLWYIVHSVVYTCDLILARIWLLGLCLFINRVLQSGIKAISTVGRSLDRTGWVLGLLLPNLCLLKLFYYYTPWILCLLPVLLWLLSLKNSFRRFWPESVIWPP